MPARIVHLSSSDDPLLRHYRDLTDVALRRVSEPAAGVFIAEGLTVIQRALDHDYQVHSMLMSPKWLPTMAPLADDREIDLLVAADEVITSLTGFHVHRGALAVVSRPKLPTWQQICEDAQRIVILEDVNSHTNVGAIIRSAAALGIDAVLLSPRCADPLYRRAVRVSMGTVFEVPWTRLPDWPTELAQLHESGFASWALTPHPDAESIRDLAVPERLALIVGAEADGLSRPALTGASRAVRIPLRPLVDSLNVAAATAVACYAVGTSQ